MSAILSLHDLPKELVDLIAKAILDLKSWLHLRLTCKRCWTLCSLDQYRIQFLIQVKLDKRCYSRLPNKLKHGEYKTWYENGQPRTLCFYKDGQREGESKIWYKNGQLDTHSFYKENLFEGEYKSWYGNGQPHSCQFYKGGYLEGEYKRWHKDGRLWEHSFYKNGKQSVIVYG
jgi:MORN repeat protein